MTTIIEQNREKLIELCRQYHVAALDVFGSAATDEFDEQGSDVDLLVEFDSSVEARRFDNFFALHEALQRLLKRPVDLVEPGGLRNPYFIDSVQKTRKRLYALRDLSACPCSRLRQTRPRYGLERSRNEDRNSSAASKRITCVGMTSIQHRESFTIDY